jgi:hypothetical protein
VPHFECRCFLRRVLNDLAEPAKVGVVLSEAFPIELKRILEAFNPYLAGHI